MPLLVASRRASPEGLRHRQGDVVVLDATSRGPQPWLRFSPFYPHGDIPLPFEPGESGMSVEGIWQGLKVFEAADVDPSRWRNTTMKGIKRSARSYGRVLGRRSGPSGDRLLSYAEARRAIYLTSYRWVLENRLQEQLAELRGLSADRMVLLDYATNCDVDNLSRPLGCGPTS